MVAAGIGLGVWVLVIAVWAFAAVFCQVGPRGYDKQTWGRLGDDAKSDQFKLIYDYIKFHIGMYMATPAVFGIIAVSLGVQCRGVYQSTIVIAILIFLMAGISASRFMGHHINTPWQSTKGHLAEFEKEAFRPWRRFAHHWSYWAGVVIGAGGILISLIQQLHEHGARCSL